MQQITSVNRFFLQAGVQNDTHADIKADQGCQAIAYERQRRTRILQDAAGNTDVDKTLYGDERTDTGAYQSPGQILRFFTGPQAFKNDQEKQHDDRCTSDESGLLSRHSEDKVVLDFRNEIAFADG